ncbi:uncharacterized protein METZ01_LOCUS15949, partial [marine metagenome]
RHQEEVSPFCVSGFRGLQRALPGCGRTCEARPGRSLHAAHLLGDDGCPESGHLLHARVAADHAGAVSRVAQTSGFGAFASRRLQMLL